LVDEGYYTGDRGMIAKGTGLKLDKKGKYWYMMT
jgi:hypothetical protein